MMKKNYRVNLINFQFMIENIVLAFNEKLTKATELPYSIDQSMSLIVRVLNGFFI